MISFLYWIKKNKIEFLVLILILSLAAFLRLYRLPEYMTFLGDEGRDALVIKRILTEADFPLLGPPTSFGNMYLGPLYYYMMAIPMAVFWLNPVSAAGMVAVMGVITVGLIYYLSREWFGKTAAVVSSILYAVSSTTIIYSRSSWNPNPAPFFSLLIILGFYLSRKYHNYAWLILSGGALAFAIQMHYLALIMIPVAVTLWVYEIAKNRDNGKYFIKWSAVAAILFLFLMSPLLIFDLKYNFMNYRALQAIFGSTGGIGFNPLDSFLKVFLIYFNNLVKPYLTVNQVMSALIMAFVLLVPIIYFIILKLRQKDAGWPFFVLSVWLFTGLVGLSLYKHSIYDHYVGFVSPVLFLLVGAVIFLISKLKKKTFQFFTLTFFLIFSLFLIVLNLQNNPLSRPPNNQLQRTQGIAKFIIKEAEAKPFNFALIAERNYDAAYQFYLGMYGHKPKIVPLEITNQLFVVCEDSTCSPVGHPKQEISHFGWVKIEKEYNFNGIKVFKLIPFNQI